VPVGHSTNSRFTYVQGVLKDLPKPHKDREAVARSILNTYNLWHNGECFWYQVDTGEQTELDSCGGFIGEDSLIDHLKRTHPELIYHADAELSGNASYVWASVWSMPETPLPERTEKS